jgi:hypothetical protein
MARVIVESNVFKKEPPPKTEVDICSAYVARHNTAPHETKVVITATSQATFISESGYITHGTLEYLRENFTVRPLRADETFTIKGTK